MKNKKIIGSLFFVILSLSIIAYVYTFNDKNSNAIKVSNEELKGLKISYLDVGQADSILIQFNNENMLIDAGNNEDGDNLVTYLKSQNIDNFKYVIGTHAHEDHIGGLDDIINNFNIETFYMPDVLSTTKTFENVIDALANKNLKYSVPTIGQTFKLGDAEFEVLYIGEDKTNLNNDSIVLKLTYNNVKFLFMGDAEKKVEEKLLKKDIKANVLKVAHHGSESSSSEKFVKAVSPNFAVISVGENNTYKLPKKKTLELYKKYNSEILRTDEVGTIVFTSDGDSINHYNIQTSIDGK